MSTSRPARASRRGVRSLLGAAVAAAALVLAPVALASPASAHDELVSTDPADGASLEEAPAAVTLTFSEEVVKLGTAVVVTDAAGVKLADGPLVVDGAVITRAITPPTVAGEVRVSYRVVSSDGHPVTGKLTFTVASVPSPSPTATAEPTESESETPEPSESSESSAAASPTDSASVEAEPSTSPVSSESTGGSALPWVLGGLAVLALAAAAVAASRRGKAGSSS